MCSTVAPPRLTARMRALRSASTTYTYSPSGPMRTAITGNNVSSAKGSFDGPLRAYSINSNDQLLTVEQYRELIVAWRGGAPVRLKDVAEVIPGSENSRLGAWSGLRGDGEAGAALAPAIILNVQRQPGANVIATVDAIQKQLPSLQQSLPESVRVQVLADRTQGIRASVRLVLAARGVDPSLFSIPEHGMLELGRPAYVSALKAYASGTPDGVRDFLVWHATAVALGAKAVVVP